MEEVLDVYERPYDPEFPVVCLDESPKQLISEVRKGFADSKGVQYFDYEYKREGVADIFMVVEPLGAKRKVFITDSHNSHQWAEVVAYIVEEMYPHAHYWTFLKRGGKSLIFVFSDDIRIECFPRTYANLAPCMIPTA